MGRRRRRNRRLTGGHEKVQPASLQVRLYKVSIQGQKVSQEESQSEQRRAETGQAEPNQDRQNQLDLSKAEPGQTRKSQVDLLRTEPGQSEPGLPESSKPSHARQSQVELSRTELSLLPFFVWSVVPAHLLTRRLF